MAQDTDNTEAQDLTAQMAEMIQGSQSEASEFEDADEPAAETPPPLPTKKKNAVAPPQPAKAAAPVEFEGPEDDDDPPAKAKPAKVETDPQVPQYDRATVARAREYGYSDDEIQEYTPAQLDRAIAREDRKAADEYRKSKATPKAETETKKKDDDPYTLDFDEKLFDENQYDPEAIRAFKSQKRVLEQLVADRKAMQEKLDRIEGTNAERERKTVLKRVDDWFNSYGDPALVGDGGLATLDKDSAEYFGRMKVLKAMDEIRQGYMAANKTPPEPEALARIAYVMAHGVAPTAAEEPARGRDLSQHERTPDGRLLPLNTKRRPTAGARPSSRDKSPTPKGDARALEGIQEALGIKGNHAVADDAAVEDSLV